MKRKTGTPPPASTVRTLRLVSTTGDRDEDRPEAQQQPAAVLAYDTIAALEKLLTDARAGELIGIAFAAAYSRRSYCTRVTDDLLENPTFARGMLCTLDDQLQRLVDGAP